MAPLRRAPSACHVPQLRPAQEGLAGADCTAGLGQAEIQPGGRPLPVLTTDGSKNGDLIRNLFAAVAAAASSGLSKSKGGPAAASMAVSVRGL